MNERAERGGGGHAAGDGAQVVEEAELEHVSGKDVADDHGQERHHHAEHEIPDVEVSDERRAAGHAGADEEEHEAQLPENLQGMLRGHQVDPADVPEMPHDEGRKQAAAGGGQGEAGAGKTVAGEGNLNGSHKHAEHRDGGEGEEGEVIQLQELGRVVDLVGGLHGHRLFAFRVHIGADDFRDELHEEHHADDAEDVGNAVSDGHRVLIGRVHRGFGRGEGGGGGQGAGEQARHHGGQLVVVAVAEAHGASDVDAEHRGDAAEDDDDEAEQHVGFEIALEIAEKLGTGDETYGGHKEHKAHVFDDFQGIRGVALGLRFHVGVEEAAEEQGHDEHAGGAERDALDCDSAERIADGGDGKQEEH